jgi:hypothetical protein
MWHLEDLYGCNASRALNIKDEFEDRGYELMEKAWKEEFIYLGGLFCSSILRQPQDLIALEESHREVHYPKGNEGRTKIQERHVYMVCRLLQLCQIIKPKRVVVIIGAAHLQGLNAGVIGSTVLISLMKS